MISQDVMEHVPDPTRGFAETARFCVPADHTFSRSRRTCTCSRA
ncbi:hypothetical protein [Lichenihabitans psoromatis]|nr:hypothetical protein [Lichenihabitans psoromatis]